jgi:hypothetical protein
LPNGQRAAQHDQNDEGTLHDPEKDLPPFAFLPIQIRTLPKNALSRIATSTEMIDRILKLYPKATRHLTLLPNALANVKCLDLTPLLSPIKASPASALSWRKRMRPSTPL